MKIGVIGEYVEIEGIKNIGFSSSMSLLDFDIILLDFNSILWEYKVEKTFRGLTSLSDDSSVKLIHDCERRKKEILELLKIGRSIVVYTPKPTKCYVDSGKREYSGTGKNRHTTRMVDLWNLIDILPIKVLTEEAQGNSIEYLENDIFKEFWEMNKEFLEYNAYFEENIGNPIFKIRSTNKVIGTYVTYEKGNLVFIPRFLDEHEDLDNENNFFASITSLISKLQVDSGKYTLPEWSEQYVLPNEDKIENEVKELEQTLFRLEEKIILSKKRLEKVRELKLLITGTGRALELKVRQAFEELGFIVSEGLPGRDDLILKLDDKIAVVEVKGVKKSAAEKHAAQLEKWVSEYYSNKNIMPKGILVVNAFKDLPLNERCEDEFPNQMLSYSTKREHCLITGNQLLELVLLNRKHKDFNTDIIDSIFMTSGRYCYLDDKDKCITIRDTITDKES